MNDFIAAIDQALREGGDRPAFVQGDQTLTCREADEIGSALHEWIRTHCRPGGRVAALTQNRIEAVLLEWATYRAGCIWLGIPAREHDAGNLARLLADFTPCLLVLERFGPYGAITFDRADFPAEEILPPPGLGPHRFRALRRTKREDRTEFSVGGEPIRRLRYSSGSSGEPKAVAYTDRTLSAMLTMISEKVLGGDAWTVVHGLPITWASGSLIAPALCRGGKNVIVEFPDRRWDPARFTRDIAQEDNVLTLLTPGVVAVLTRYSATDGVGWARGLRRVLLAGGPTPVWTMRRAWKLFSPATKFIVTLGQTEASFPITWHPVVEADLDNRKAGPAVLPLGPFTAYYRGSRVDADSREILLKGDPVAPARWIPGGALGTGRFAPFPMRRKLHKTGDRAIVKGKMLHYLGRVTDPWRCDASLPPAEALEAVLNDAPGVRRSRVDSMEDTGDVIAAEVTVQAEADSLDVNRAREHFEDNKREARLGSIHLERIHLGDVEVTLSGKIRRSGPPADGGPASGGSPSPPAGSGSGTPRVPPLTPGPFESKHWKSFDFSRIASGPIYYYVGAGLSMQAGLVGWWEMACLIWTYRKVFEGRELPACPGRTAAEIEPFLDDFVHETVDGKPGSRPILTRRAGGGSADAKTLGRVALLNMLFRYRKPRTRLVQGGDKAVVDAKERQRDRPGQEPSQEDLLVQSMIWRSRCHGVFTTNYDMLLEHAFSLFHHGAALRTYRYQADYLRFLLSNPRFVLKLHGDINDIATMELCPTTAWDKGGRLSAWGRGRDLTRVYRAALDRGHMIYLGCGFRDETIRKLHASWKHDPRSLYCRVALLFHDDLTDPTDPNAVKEIEETPRHGIELLTFDEYGQVREFMKRVVSARSGARERWSACPEATDLHRQLFLGSDPTRATPNFSTVPWSCQGIARRA